MPLLQRRHALPLAVLLCLTGCAGPRQTVVLSQPPTGQRGVIFVADGAGNFQRTSAATRTVAQEAGLPLMVQTVEWSHGYPRVLADHLDYAHAREEGAKLAAQVAALRQECPDAEVYFLAHSDGCGVVLAAAEALPPCSIDRIVLLAPAVSAEYDLRPALRATRQTVDVFISDRDRVFLGLVPGLVGTSDRRWTSASGRIGFAPHLDSADDAVLYGRLRHFPWSPAYTSLGNRGGHYDSYRPEFLRTCVLPLFRREAPCQLAAAH